MFFFDDDINFNKTKNTATIKIPPPVPETGWRPPTTLPNLTNAVMLSIDVETKEPDFDHGPGWGRGKGHIVGFSVGAQDSLGNVGSWYFPLRHEVEPEYNLDATICLRWLKTIMETPHIPKVGANLLYDIGWLTTENIYVKGELHDVQFAEALLHEEGLVNLEYLGQKYTKQGKDSSVLYQWLAQAYGGSACGKQRANIYRCSPRLVGFYAESDAFLPIKILEKQWSLLEKEHLLTVYRMECDSIYLLTQMRLTGVNINISEAEKLYDELALDIQKLQNKLYDLTGVHANVLSAADLAKVFDVAGIVYSKTSKGNPSFTKEYLNKLEHPIADIIREIREYDKIRSTFIRSYLLESNVGGRVHCQFHPLRGDAGGTRSGRFSSDKPNLQNIPIRTALGQRVRQLFIPDDGHLCWEKNDYSQIEYRALVHFAVGEGADTARTLYNDDPKTDYHKMTQKLVFDITGISIDRKPIKNINFGLLYGMGQNKLARQAGISQNESSTLFRAYHTGNPYVKATMDATASEAQTLGYITTIMNRRSRFDKWEPRQINYEQRAMALNYHHAINEYGIDIQRAHTHKAINRRLQGSAADVIKKAMHQCWKEGVFDVIGVPKLQVHDELDFSVKDDSKEQNEGFAYMRHVLENATKLRVPIIVDAGRGTNWGSIA